MGSRRVGHDWATSFSLFTFMHWRRKWQPTPVFLPGESHGRQSLVGCHLWGLIESDTTEATWQADPFGSAVKNPPAVQKMQEMWVGSLGPENLLEEGMATHSNILTWRIPWTEQPGGLWSMGSERVGHDWNDWACTHRQLEASFCRFSFSQV